MTNSWASPDMPNNQGDVDYVVMPDGAPAPPVSFAPISQPQYGSGQTQYGPAQNYPSGYQHYPQHQVQQSRTQNAWPAPATTYYLAGAESSVRVGGPEVGYYYLTRRGPGQICDMSFRLLRVLIRKVFLSSLAFLAFVSLIVSISQFQLGEEINNSTSSFGGSINLLDFAGTFTTLLVVTRVISTIGKSAAMAATISEVSAMYLLPINGASSVKRGMSAVARSVGYSMLQLLVLGLGVGLIFGEIALLTAGGGELSPIMLIAVVAIVPATLTAVVYVHLRLEALPAVSIAEGKSFAYTWRRTWKLAKGSVMRMFGVRSILGLIGIVLGTAITIVLSIVGTASNSNEIALIAASTLALTLTETASACLAGSAITIQMFDMRIRNEGFDLQVMTAQQSGPKL